MKINILKAASDALSKIKLPKRRTKGVPGDVVYSPAEISTTGSRITGIILRSIILFMGIFGLSAFLLDFCGLTANEAYWAGFYVPLWYIALAAAAVAAVFGVASYSKKASLIAFPAALILYFGISAILNGDPFSFMVNSIVRVYNFTLYVMVSKGYMYFGDYMIAENYDYSGAFYVADDPYRMGGAFLITAVIGIILGFAVYKKIRLYILVPAVALVLTPVLIFNLTTNTVGWAFTLAFLAAVITVYIYDYRFGGALEARNERIRRRLEKKEKKRLEKLRRREEKKRLQEEADRMLMAALKADMGTKKSRLARKAVFKADRLAKKNAKKAARLKAKTEKKEKKLSVKTEKAEIKKLKKSASGGDSAATDALKARIVKRAEAKKQLKAEKAEKKRIKREKQHRSSLISAAGGFAGIGAAVIALIAVGIPALAVSKPFPIIAPVYNRMHIANTYVTAYLSGNDIDLNDLSSYGIEELMPRTLSFDALEFEEKPMFKVSTTGENNIYMKSWVGDSFDYYSDTWAGADYDKVLAFRQSFGQDFTPDSITTAFKNYVYPATAEVTDAKLYKNFSKFGFNMQSVDVIRLDGYSRLLPIPSAMDTNWAILQLNSLERTDKKYSLYFDGLYSSRFFEAGDPMRTVSYVPRMNREGVGAELENAMEYYNRSTVAIEAMKIFRPEFYDSEIYNYEMKFQEEGITYVGTSLIDRYYNQMSEFERLQFDRAVALEKQYRKYAEENYLTSFGSERITELAAQLKAQAEEMGISTQHDLIVSVIDYLGNTCTYTTEPDRELYPGAGSIIDAFIFDVKEGYCTHFATAACAILREMGIPTRFAEGYIATDFSVTRGFYESTVLDSNAHAWIEVYYDGMGWITYEATPEYSEAMYSPDGATFEPVDPNTGESTPPAEPPTEEKEEDPDDFVDIKEEGLTEIQIFLIVAGCTALTIILILVGRYVIKRFIRRGLNMLEDRYSLINYAKDEDAWKNPKTDRRAVARRLNDQILDIFATIGVGIEPGELSSEYAKRIAAGYGDLSRIDVEIIFSIIQREEFGNGLSFEETCMLAEYLADITASVYAGLSKLQKIKYRYIMRKI